MLLVFLAIGLGAGVLSGLFGIGGGIVIVPALIFFAKFQPQMATGTSLGALPMRPGTVVEVTIAGIGTLRNTFAP